VIALRRKLDLWIVVSVVFLVGVGILAIFSASTALGEEKFGSSYFFLKRHLVRVVLGVLVFCVALMVPIDSVRKWAPYVLLVSVVLLGLSLGATQVRNTHRFLSIASVSLQPAELARVALILSLAPLLSLQRKTGSGLTPRMLLLAGGAIVLPAVLVFCQPSFSVGVALIVSGLVVVFVAGLPLRYVFAGVCLALPLLLLVAHSHEYQWQRLVEFYDGEPDPLGHEWQLSQSLIALGSGGLTGSGFGASVQKKFFLPDAHTDFVFAIFGEESGFMGTSMVLFAYLVFLWRGFQIAGRARERFCSLAATGLTASVSLFVFANLAVVTGLIPTTGLPLPFMSYGGSALLMNMFSAGLLCNIGAKLPGYKGGKTAYSFGGGYR
jgi:cell division protein FtsW